MTVPDPGPLLAHLLVLIVVSAVALAVGRRAGVVQQTGVALVLHLLVAGAIHSIAGLWSPDAMHYDRLGLAFQDYWFHGAHIEPYVTSGKEGLPWMLAVLYETFGHHPFLGVLVNVGFATLVVPVVASTSRVMGVDGRWAAWLAACLPPILLWGSVLLREAAAWLLVALIVRGLAGLAAEEPRSWRNWAAVLLPLAPLVTVRGTAAVLVGGAALVTFAATARQRTVPVLVGIVGLVLAGPALLSVVDEIAGGYDVDTINRQRASLSRDASSSFEVEAYESVGAMLLGAPLALLRGAIGPFPWELPALGPFLILDTFFWWLLVVMVVVGIRHAPSRRVIWAPLIPALTMLTVLSLTSGNYGTMTRLRYQVAAMLLPLAGHGLAVLWRRRRADRPAAGVPEAAVPAGGFRRTATSAGPGPGGRRTPGSGPSAPRRAPLRPSRPAPRTAARGRRSSASR